MGVIMPTEKLFYEDINKTEFEARVLEVKAEKKGYRVVLDRTCFYPEGGGQPADKGWINGIPVLDVQTEREVICHYLKENPGTGVVKGKIDLQWRIDFIQQHTGQHIVSGALWKVGKYKTVSVHMGSDHTTIEIDSQQISSADLEKVENLANRVINRNLPIEFIMTDEQGIDRFELRKPCPVDGEIRLVRIGDFDCVGCGGLHFENTGQVGLVKATGIEKIRGHARLSWKIGQRAIQDYRKKDKIVAELKTVLETREDHFPDKVREIQTESIQHKKKASLLLNRLAAMMAEDFYEKGKSFGDSSVRPVIKSWKNEDNELIKRIMKELLKRSEVLICLVNTVDETVYWSIGCSGEINFDFDRHKSGLLALINGKGGGRHPLWQGTGQNPEKTEVFLSKFTDLAKSL